MSQKQLVGSTGANSTANPPIHAIRYGAVRAAIWKNVSGNDNVPRDRYSVTFSRGYNDGNQWRDTASFGVEDLLLLAKVADEAHTWISSRRSSKVSPA